MLPVTLNLLLDSVKVKFCQLASPSALLSIILFNPWFPSFINNEPTKCKSVVGLVMLIPILPSPSIVSLSVLFVKKDKFAFSCWFITTLVSLFLIPINKPSVNDISVLSFIHCVYNCSVFFLYKTNL